MWPYTHSPEAKLANFCRLLYCLRVIELLSVNSLRIYVKGVHCWSTAALLADACCLCFWQILIVTCEWCVISGFRSSGMLRSVDWIYLPTFHDNPSVPSSKLWHLKMGPMGCHELSVTINLRCVTSQKSEELIWMILIHYYVSGGT